MPNIELKAEGWFIECFIWEVRGSSYFLLTEAPSSVFSLSMSRKWKSHLIPVIVVGKLSSMYVFWVSACIYYNLILLKDPFVQTHTQLWTCQEPCGGRWGSGYRLWSWPAATGIPNSPLWALTGYQTSICVQCPQVDILNVRCLWIESVCISHWALQSRTTGERGKKKI